MKKHPKVDERYSVYPTPVQVNVSLPSKMFIVQRLSAKPTDVDIVALFESELDAENFVTMQHRRLQKFR